MVTHLKDLARSNREQWSWPPLGCFYLIVPMLLGALGNDPPFQWRAIKNVV